MAASRVCIVTFDGACAGNPGGAMGLGWTVDGRPGRAFVPAGPRNTNNVAEYLALAAALDEVPEDATHVEIGGDSQLVVSQLTGEYAVKSPSLRPYWEAVCAKLDALRVRGVRLVLVWHPREHNAAADEQSHLALAENGIRLVPHEPPEGFSTLADAGRICGKSAVMVGRCLAFLGYRDGGGCTPKAEAEGIASLYLPYSSPVPQVSWHSEEVAALVAAAPPGAFAARPSATRAKKERMVEIAGNSYPAREVLKALGGRWKPNKRCWLVPESRADEARRAVASAGMQARSTR